MISTKTPPVYGDELPITPFQIKRIMQNCQYNIPIKDEWVQWATGDVNRTSLKSITQAQAVKILKQQTGDNSKKVKLDISDNWGFFDKKNKQHLTLLSQLRTLQWTVSSEKWGELSDIERLSDFLKSNESPIKKPLKSMEPFEVSKMIECFKSMVRKKYK